MKSVTCNYGCFWETINDYIGREIRSDKVFKLLFNLILFNFSSQALTIYFGGRISNQLCKAFLNIQTSVFSNSRLLVNGEQFFTKNYI